MQKTLYRREKQFDRFQRAERTISTLTTAVGLSRATLRARARSLGGSTSLSRWCSRTQYRATSGVEKPGGIITFVVRTPGKQIDHRRAVKMREKIERYSRKLEGLSTEELSRSAEKLVSLRRRNDAALIAHLVELSRRTGHLELGYRSLFYYCVEHLHLGESSSWKRTQVAGVASRFPQVLEHLAEGKVNLSVLSILAKHLTDENVDGLLKEAEGKTTRAAKEIVAAVDPKPAAKPTIRRKPVRSRESAEVSADRAEVAEFSQEKRPERPERGRGTLEVARPELYNIKFSAGKEFTEKFERLAEVLGIENTERRMPEIFERALDLALEKKDPRKKLERRRKREARRATGSAGGAGVPLASSPEKVSRAKKEVSRARYVRSSVRERVLERAGYQCEFMGTGGVRCSSRTGLEIDHVDPYAKGGGGSEENLRALCRAHNLFSAAREFGAEFMRGKIEGDVENLSPVLSSA